MLFSHTILTFDVFLCHMLFLKLPGLIVARNIFVVVRMRLDRIIVKLLLYVCIFMHALSIHLLKVLLFHGTPLLSPLASVMNEADHEHEEHAPQKNSYVSLYNGDLTVTVLALIMIPVLKRSIKRIISFFAHLFSIVVAGLLLIFVIFLLTLLVILIFFVGLSSMPLVHIIYMFKEAIKRVSIPRPPALGSRIVECTVEVSRIVKSVLVSLSIFKSRLAVGILLTLLLLRGRLFVTIGVLTSLLMLAEAIKVPTLLLVRLLLLTTMLLLRILLRSLIPVGSLPSEIVIPLIARSCSFPLGTLACVAKDFIGSLNFLELLDCFAICFVWVVLLCHSVVCKFDFFLRHAWIQSEDLPVVFFRVKTLTKS